MGVGGQPIDDELKISARLVEADPAAQANLQPILNLQADGPVATGEPPDIALV